jgi:hypothetical protein
MEMLPMMSGSYNTDISPSHTTKCSTSPPLSPQEIYRQDVENDALVKIKRRKDSHCDIVDTSVVPIVPPIPPDRVDSYKRKYIAACCSARHKVGPITANKRLEDKSFIIPVVLENPGFEGVHERIKGKDGSFEKVVELLDEMHDTDSTYILRKDDIVRPKSLYDQPSVKPISPEIAMWEVNSSKDNEIETSFIETSEISHVFPPTYHSVMHKKGVYDVAV